jgi:hypothetical protein
MAATVSNKNLLTSTPYVLCQLTFSSLVAGLTETVSLPTSLGWPTGVAPDRVTPTVTTAPTSNDDVKFSWTASSTSADTITVKFDTEGGGSLDGAVVVLELRALAQATGGITAPTVTA